MRSGKQRSAAVYNADIKGAHANKQNAMVVAVMLKLNQPTTIRMMQKAINGRGWEIDIVSLRRAVTNLSKPHPKHGWQNHFNKGILHVAYESACPITGKRVGWYQIIPGVLQLDLFAKPKSSNQASRVAA